MWAGGIATAVIKQLSKRTQDPGKERAQRLLKAYVRWHLKRGESDEAKARERDRRLLGTHKYKMRHKGLP